MKAYSALKSVLLALILGVGLGFAQPAEAASTLNIDQQSTINRYGRWELVTPTSFFTSRNKSQQLSSLPSGTYELTILPPNGAKTTLRFLDGDTVIQEIEGTTAKFELNGSVAIRIQVVFTYAGTITVHSEPLGAKFELKGSQNIRLTGVTPATFTNLPPSYYTVTYSQVEDCQLPKRQSRSLEANSTVIFNADFICADELPIVAPEPPAPAPVDRTDLINVRLWNSFHQAEAASESSVLVTVGVRNITKSTIHNLKLSQSFDPNQVTMPVVLPRGGALQHKQIVWDIPQIFAGQSWTATFPVTLNTALPIGEQIQLIAHVSGDEVRSPRGELLSEVAIVGIASMPQTGEMTPKSIALLVFALAGASLILTFTIRRKSYVVSTVSR